MLSGLSIPFLMVLFGFLMVQNTKNRRKRLHPQVSVHHMLATNQDRTPHVTDTMKKRDSQLIVMLLVQLSVYFVSCIPFPAYLLYTTATMNWVKSARQMAVDDMFMTVAYTLLYMNFSATFYIYTLTSPIFRKDLKRLLLGNRLVNACLPIQQNTQSLTANKTPNRDVTQYGGNRTTAKI
jgi:uncharacterized membrane protein (DUF485 family)